MCVTGNTEFIYRLLITMYLPQLVVLIYCIYWTIQKIASCCFYCKPTKQKQTETTEEYILSLDVNDTFADRIMNPDEYDERHVSTLQSESPLVVEPLTTCTLSGNDSSYLHQSFINYHH